MTDTTDTKWGIISHINGDVVETFNDRTEAENRITQMVNELQNISSDDYSVEEIRRSDIGYTSINGDEFYDDITN